MAEIQIKHAFVSLKPDSQDSTIVSSSEWNAPLIVSGGSQGNHIARDANSSTGASFVDGPRIFTAGGTYTGASPSPALSSITITHTTAASIFFAAGAKVTTSTAGGAQCIIQRNGVTIDVFNAGGTGIAAFWGVGYVEVPGTAVYTIQVGTFTGTFTSLETRLTITTVGIA